MKLTILIIALQVLNLLASGILTLITIETDKQIDKINAEINDIKRTKYRL